LGRRKKKLDNCEQLPNFIKSFADWKTNSRNFLAALQEFVEERKPAVWRKEERWPVHGPANAACHQMLSGARIAKTQQQGARFSGNQSSMPATVPGTTSVCCIHDPSNYSNSKSHNKQRPKQNQRFGGPPALIFSVFA